MAVHQTIPLAVLAAGFGALVGSLGTLLVRVYHERKKASRDRDMVRNALLSELEAAATLETIADHLRSSGSLTNIHPDPAAFVSNTVYEGHIDKLGLLKEEERREVIAYYAHIEAVIPFIDIFNEQRQTLEDMSESVDDEAVLGRIEDGIEDVEVGISKVFDQARQNRDDAVQILRQSLHK